MSLPTQTQLERQKKETEEKIQRLKQSYDIFVSEWESISHKEKDLLEELQQYVDKSKIHNVLSVIHSIKE